jgi:hypothetical protein
MRLRKYNKDYTDCKPGLLSRVGETQIKFVAVPLRHSCKHQAGCGLVIFALALALEWRWQDER